MQNLTLEKKSSYQFSKMGLHVQTALVAAAIIVILFKGVWRNWKRTRLSKKGEKICVSKKERQS